MKNNVLNNKIFKDWIIPIIVPVIAIFLINKFIAFKAYVPSESMSPTLKTGDYIIATRVYKADKLKRGDVLVFYSEERKELLVKRLIGLPGEKVRIDQSGQVLVNGLKIEEPYVVNKNNLPGDFTVPDGKYLFLGDNRASSLDARLWSNPYIDQEDIKGKARFIFFPFNRFGRFVIG